MYLLNNGDSVYEEKILAERHTIEAIVKQTTDLDVTLKGFTTEACAASSDQNGKSSDNKDFGGNADTNPNGSTNKGEQISDEEYGQKVIEFFGEDIVTFID